METVLTPLDMLAVEGDGLAVVVAIVIMEAVVAFDVVVVSVVIVGGVGLAVVVEIVLMEAVEAFDVVVVSVVIAVSVMYLKYNF